MNNFFTGFRSFAAVSAVGLLGAIGAPMTASAINSLSVQSVTGSCGSDVFVTIQATGANNLSSFGFDVDFNAACVDYVVDSAEGGSLLGAGWNVDSNLLDSDTVRVGGIRSSAPAVSGDGSLVTLAFRSSASVGCDCVSNIDIVNPVDAANGATISNGTLTVEDTSDTSPELLVTRTFDSSTEGYQYIANPAIASPPFAMDSAGFLLLASDNNNSTFGFYLSPNGEIDISSFDPLADGSQSGDLFERRGPLYLVRAYTRRTTADPERAVQLRLRVNSSNFADFHTTEVQSPPAGIGRDARFVPSNFVSEPIDMLFEPNVMMYGEPDADQTYNFAFDIINFTPEDDPFGGYLIDSLEIYRVPLGAISSAGSIRTYTFDSAADTDEWTGFTFPGSFAEPTQSKDTGAGVLRQAATQPDNLFGNFQSDTLTQAVPSSSDKLFVQLHFQVTTDETNSAAVPDMRFRGQTDDFQKVVAAGTVGLPSSDITTSNGNLRNHFAFLEVPSDGGGTINFTSAWDILSFEDPSGANPSSTTPVELDTVDISFISIANYPAVK